MAVLHGHSNSPGMPVPKLRRDKDKPGEDPAAKRMREWDEFTDWVPRLENFLQAINQQLTDLSSKCQETEVKNDRLGADVHNVEMYSIADDTWIELSPMPASRFRFAAATTGRPGACPIATCPLLLPRSLCGHPPLRAARVS